MNTNDDCDDDDDDDDNVLIVGQLEMIVTRTGCGEREVIFVFCCFVLIITSPQCRDSIE